MIVIGKEHQFSRSELKAVKLALQDIDYLSINSLNTNNIIERIEKEVKYKNTHVVINTKDKALDELLEILTEKELKNKVSSFTTKSFFEEKLRKTYVPKSFNNYDKSVVAEIHRYSFFNYVQKRVIDYIGATSLLLLFWPVMLYSYFRIKSESPEGPVLFKQKRVGIDDKEFDCIKFRSMKMGAEKHGAQFAEEDDPRVFNWGKTMRSTRIDELPQILNIYKGEMHFIGPRPERKVWVNQFKEFIPYYDARHNVKPGVTGWAQVMYPYGTDVEDARQKLTYDLYYIKKWSIVFELEIIFKTVMVVLGRKGL